MLNLGGSAYGTDQALLSYKILGKNLATHCVALGVTAENINRIVNVYRKFYFPQSGINLTNKRLWLEAWYGMEQGDRNPRSWENL